MGAYHIFVNPDKKEYFDPAQFSDGIKVNALFNGLHRHALRILMYSCDLSSSPVSTDFHSWVGDRIFIAADDYESDKKIMFHLTNENTNQNLSEYAMENYTDISFVILKYLLVVQRKDSILSEIYAGLEMKTSLFANVVQIYQENKSKILQEELEHHIGKDWMKKYSKMISKA